MKYWSCASSYSAENWTVVLRIQEKDWSFQQMESSRTDLYVIKNAKSLEQLHWNWGSFFEFTLMKVKLEGSLQSLNFLSSPANGCL